MFALVRALIWIIAYEFAVVWLGGWRGDHAIFGLVLAACFTLKPAPGLRAFMIPFALTGMFYDSQRYWGSFLRGDVHVQAPYVIDWVFFGIDTAHGRLTPNEWLQQHIHPALDLFAGAIYLGFFWFYIAIAAWLAFVRKRPEGKTLSWQFLFLNILGISTYYWFPAAPPWYVEKFGFGPANLSVPSDPAGAARFDALLGVDFLASMYARAAHVFGAVPSLHAAFPFLLLIVALRLKELRLITVIFTAGMAFAAVYLNHHYVFDVLMGWAYAWLISGLTSQRLARGGLALRQAWPRRWRAAVAVESSTNTPSSAVRVSGIPEKTAP